MDKHKQNISILIADDEPRLGQYLQDQIESLWPEASIVARVENGDKACAAIENLNPDIAFLDIRMPGKDGLSIAMECGKDCHIVFVTAYEQHAVEAFQLAAVDYLLKPVTDDRLRECIERLQNKLMQEQPPDQQQLMAAIAKINNNTTDYINWLRVSKGDGVELVAVDSVVYFRAMDKYTSVFTADNEYLIRATIKSLKHQIDPQQFWQIHRSVLVRVDEIERLEKGLRGRYRLHLHSRQEVLIVSRNYSRLFKPH